MSFNRFGFSVHVLHTVVLLLACGASAAEKSGYVSHAPMRALPAPADRPLADGRGFFVDGSNGDDRGDGSAATPWRTIQHAVDHLNPGDTLYLRGGIYYENVRVNRRGSADQPITLRSHPRELAIIDGGLRDFYDAPQSAWEPAPDGAAGEFQSVKSYPGLNSTEDNHAHVFGLFTDSMVPLHGYRNRVDLQSDNEFWRDELLSGKHGKMGTATSIYCGPGVWYDLQSQRIHIRLAHTNLQVLGPDNYRGETDPRKLRLVICGGMKTRPLHIVESAHIKVQDLVVRGGARNATIELTDCEDIELDGVTSYGAASCFAVERTRRLRVFRSAFRSNAAPWSFRTSLKYRGAEGEFFGGSKYGGDSQDYEIAHCEFTDSHDGILIGNVRDVKFHHNLVENTDDDGMFLTAHTDREQKVWGGNIHIYQNVFRRCMTCFAFGEGHGVQTQTGAGVWIYRNIFDLRQPVRYVQPAGANDASYEPAYGRLAADHGGPIWEPMHFYHNTVLTAGPPFQNWYAAGLASHMGNTTRYVYNNIFAQTKDIPGEYGPPNEPGHGGLAADANLSWSYQAGPSFQGDFFERLRLNASKHDPIPQWEVHGLFADPKFVSLSEQGPPDVRLSPDSPAIDASIDLPSDWPDPLRGSDAGKPDLGALPLGASLPVQLSR